MLPCRGVLSLRPRFSSEESIGPSASPFADGACARGPVDSIGHELARPAGRTTRALEGFQIFGKNGPHDADFDSVEALSHEQPAHVGLRCIELGRSLGDGQETGTLNRRILARERNHFLL